MAPAHDFGNLSRRTIHALPRADLHDDRRVVISVHQAAHGSGKRHVQLDNFVGRIQSLSPLAEDSGHLKGLTADVDAATDGV